MKTQKNIFAVLLVLLSVSVFAAPASSGKLAGTETAFIGNNTFNIGLMDSSTDLFEMVSVKTNIPFDALGLYNIAVKAGYRFRNFMDLRIAAGYTGYYLNEKQALTTIANTFLKDSGITINSLDLNIKAQKIYFALMLPVYGFNVHTNYALYYLGSNTSYSKATLGLEKTFFDNKLSVFANGGMFFNLPTVDASGSSIYYNSLVTNYYADGGFRLYLGDHFNIDAGVIYPGIKMYLGDDPDTGKAKILDIPVLPVFNISYRF